MNPLCFTRSNAVDIRDIIIIFKLIIAYYCFLNTSYGETVVQAQIVCAS